MALVVSFFINLFITTVFAEGFHGTKEADNVGLENAKRFLEAKYGGGLLPILYLCGIGLHAAGQSSTTAETYVGQFIMEEFFDFKLKQWPRALITRGLAIVPTMVVAIACDTSEVAMDVLNEWLNVVQLITLYWMYFDFAAIDSSGSIQLSAQTRASELILSIRAYVLASQSLDERETFIYSLSEWLPILSLVHAFFRDHGVVKWALKYLEPF